MMLLDAIFFFQEYVCHIIAEVPVFNSISFNRSLGRKDALEKGNSLQCSCLEDPMDRRAWQAVGHRVAQHGMLGTALEAGTGMVSKR